MNQSQGTIPALDVIEIDEKYQALAEYLLGNVFIAENEEALQDSNGSVYFGKAWKICKRKILL